MGCAVAEVDLQELDLKRHPQHSKEMFELGIDTGASALAFPCSSCALPLRIATF